ncbi:hypothetical protein U5801_27115 [Lamprobacter modestohalophilus]|uniref:3-coathanger stack domain-containing protein n=1 Tax=Lamprobacter modestohalophilus TaxID=1064514 RepID=UPI002ADEC5A4|nr:3-coathanger stack domain-containing protein [Lamprobacter modestohalophilus]MEA1053445.1 hypothetical protein [Lamprobacter modestohalophilus]
MRAYYDANDPAMNRTGVAFNLHWDSSTLTHYEVAGLLAAPFQWQSSVQPDTDDLDGDPVTDSYLTLGWYHPAGDWPAAELPAMLGYIGFSVSNDFSGDTPLNLVGLSSAPNADGTVNALDLSSAVLSTEPSEPPTYQLTVTKTGTGTGTVSGDGIDCGADCTEEFAEGTPVSLNAAAADGSTFAGWSGTCSGSAACQVTLTAPTTVAATFDLEGGGTDQCQSDPITFTEQLVQGTWLVRSETQITTIGPVSLDTTANVTFEAGERIQLNPGFRVAAGANFIARITPVTCGL